MKLSNGLKIIMYMAEYVSVLEMVVSLVQLLCFHQNCGQSMIQLKQEFQELKMLQKLGIGAGMFWLGKVM